MSSTKQNKIALLNDSFFGRDTTKRYVMRVYSDCLEKIILVNTINELWVRDEAHHNHVEGVGCSKCDVFSQVSYSCTDSLFLHLRLLFSREEPLLASDFLNTLSGIDKDDITVYFKMRYDYALSEAEFKNLQQVIDSADSAVGKISKIYIKRIEPYQSYVFHQQVNGRHYKVASSAIKGGSGLKIINNIKSDKFKRDLVSARDILVEFSEVLHHYKKTFCVYQNNTKINVDNYVAEITKLINACVQKDEIDQIVKVTTSHVDNLVHALECSDGLKNHNTLTSIALKRHMTQ